MPRFSSSSDMLQLKLWPLFTFVVKTSFKRNCPSTHQELCLHHFNPVCRSYSEQRSFHGSLPSKPIRADSSRRVKVFWCAFMCSGQWFS